MRLRSYLRLCDGRRRLHNGTTQTNLGSALFCWIFRLGRATGGEGWIAAPITENQYNQAFLGARGERVQIAAELCKNGGLLQHRIKSKRGQYECVRKFVSAFSVATLTVYLTLMHSRSTASEPCQPYP